MNCPSCGEPVRSGRRFCAGCGSALARTCRGCGAVNEDADRFCGTCGRPLDDGTAVAGDVTPPPVPASFAGGRYVVERFLGEGGRKRVYLARDGRLDRRVAIAVIKSEGLDEQGLERVLREAQSMARLGDHPNIVTVYDIGDEASGPFIVSQYMAGGSLADVLAAPETRRLDPTRAALIGAQVCAGLAHAHANGVVHRDLKPGNVWLAEDGTVKLGDFGLAMAAGRSRITLEGMMLGTVGYMAPEQAVGREVDARADLYALGCVLYEMVTGRPPFLGDDAVAIVTQHLGTAPVAPSWHNAAVPGALETLMLRLLAKAPEDRPASADAVREALAAIAAGEAPPPDAIPAAANPLDRMAAGVFVGREGEIAELRAAVDESLGGYGRLVLLVGEPGIGKTFTAEETATYARLRGAQVLWGRCYEGEGAPAYWPWVQIVRAYAHEREPGPLAAELGPGAADIAQIVSEVADRIPGLPAPPVRDPEQARFRLFDSITTFLRNASATRPLLLVVDDLHWADKPSLLLLQFLARELRGSRLLILGTYRDVELGRRHPLVQALGELAREQTSRRILLRGLSERDVTRFVEVAAGVSASPKLIRAVHRQTEGNPFFVNEVVRLLVAERRLDRPDEAFRTVSIPQSVREVVGRRLDRLSDGCNRVLSVASVVGREFGRDILDRVADVGGDDVLDALEEAVAARVLVEVPSSVGRYAFSHHIIRQTLYEELSPSQRIRLHRRIGETFEAMPAPSVESHVAELAYHFAEGAQAGGDVAKAVDYAVRAGRRAVAQLAYEEGAEQLERALQVMELQASDARLRCDILLSLGEARNASGEFEKGKEPFRAAAALARERGDAVALARAGLGFGGRVVPAGTVDTEGIALLTESLGAIEGDPSLRAVVLGRLAMELYWTGDRDRMGSLSREAVQIARTTSETATLGYALESRHWALWGPDDLEERLAVAREIARLSERAGDRELEAQARQWLICDLLEAGDVGGVDRELAAHERLAAEMRQPFYQWRSVRWRAMRALMSGDVAEGERLMNEAATIGSRAQDADVLSAYGTQLAILRREQGRVTELFDAVRTFVENNPTIPAWRLGLAYIEAEAGRRDEAVRDLEAGLTALPRDAAWIMGTAFASLAACLLGGAEQAARIYEDLRPYAARLVVAPYAIVCLGSVDGFLGALAAAAGRPADAAAHFEAAIALDDRIGARAAAARDRLGYGRMLLDAGDTMAAIGHLSAAQAAFASLGMTTLADKATALKVHAQGAGGSGTSSIDTIASAAVRDSRSLSVLASPGGEVTIVFSDIEGFTAMTERLGDRRAQEVLRAHNALVRREVALHGGTEVRSQGDGFMLAFADPLKAVACAVAVQRAIASAGLAEPIRVRIGLHAGEAIAEAGDFQGRNVILAARIADSAAGGEILVSEQIASVAGSFELGEARPLRLKGFAGSHAVYPLRWS
jgi:class 3 adenylate cyclase/tetratricopeptide (TPR) repeat protein